MTQFVIKRIYEPANPNDGYRVLVDRLWPRGVSKERAALDEWAKDIAPSTDLRKWFAHDPQKWTEFTRRYRLELQGNPAWPELQAIARQKALTLVYAAKDEVHNEAVVLRRLLDDEPKQAR